MPTVNLGQVINLSESSNYSTWPQVAVLNDKNVYVVWHESSGIYGPQKTSSDELPKKSVNILYRVSHDNGSLFDEAKQLYASQSIMSFPPTISSSNRIVFAAWADISSDNHDFSTEVYFARSEGGGRFETPRRLDVDGTPEKLADRVRTINDATATGGPASRRRNMRSAPSPRIAISGGNVYVVWLGIRDLLAGKHRAEYGTHEQDVECDILFRVSHDYGGHFSDATGLGKFRVRGTHQGGANLASFGPFILKAVNRNVYVSWHELGAGPNAGSTFFRKSTDEGQSFSPPFALNRMYGSKGADDTTANQRGGQDIPSIQVCAIEVEGEEENKSTSNERDKNDDELFAAWLVQDQHGSEDKFDLFSLFRFNPLNLKQSMYIAKMVGNSSSDKPNRINFPSYTKITDAAWGGTDSFIRFSGHNVYAFWNDINTGEITVKCSKDGGYNFGPPSGIRGTDPARRNSSNLPVGPFVLCKGPRIFAAWHSYLGGQLGGYSGGPRAQVISKNSGPREYHLPRTTIQFSTSSDNGASFSAPETISQEDNGRASNVNFAISGEDVYIAWSQGNESNPDIFFRTGKISQ